MYHIVLWSVENYKQHIGVACNVRMSMAHFGKIDQLISKLKWGHTHKTLICDNPFFFFLRNIGKKLKKMKLAPNVHVIFIKQIYHFADTGIMKHTNASNKHDSLCVRNPNILQVTEVKDVSLHTRNISVCCHAKFTISYAHTHLLMCTLSYVLPKNFFNTVYHNESGL
jgi:hypothetical protein